MNMVPGAYIIKHIFGQFTLKHSVALISFLRLTPKFELNYAEISFIILGPDCFDLRIGLSDLHDSPDLQIFMLFTCAEVNLIFS